MTRHREAGFTLIEVTVSAVIIAIVMVGMSTVLMNYSSSRNRVNGLTIARIICESELDDVLLHSQIENSLVSDTGGRSRALLLVNRSLTVSNFYYCNFPAGVNHDVQGMWDPAAPNYTSRFLKNALYSAGGILLSDSYTSPLLGINDPRVTFVVRRQLYGVSTNLSDIEGYITGPIAPDNIDYYNSTTDHPALIADTCHNLNGDPFPALGVSDAKSNDPTYNSYDQKILVVRVYSKKTFLTNGNGQIQLPFPKFLDDSTSKAKIELTHAYSVINGKIRL